MRIVFTGSAPLACPLLGALAVADGDELVGVVTQPDRPKGRRLKMASSAVKTFAADLGVPILTPAKINDEKNLDALKELNPDLMVVVAYGQILGRKLLELPQYGCVNVHASLLPRYRGAAPIAWAVANGETETGVTTMLMNSRMDEGDILLQQDVSIGSDETAGELADRLAAAAVPLLLRTIEALGEGSIERRVQDEADASSAPKLTREDGRIDWTLTAAAIGNRVRGFNPRPGCFCIVPACGEYEVLKVHRARAEEAGGSPGTVLDCDGDGALIAAGEGSVRLLEVQPAGRKIMNGAAYVCGHRMSVGSFCR